MDELRKAITTLADRLADDLGIRSTFVGPTLAAAPLHHLTVASVRRDMVAYLAGTGARRSDAAAMFDSSLAGFCEDAGESDAWAAWKSWSVAVAREAMLSASSVRRFDDLSAPIVTWFANYDPYGL